MNREYLMDVIVTDSFWWGWGGGWVGGLTARDDEMTITKLLCPSDGKRYILGPNPPNFFLRGEKGSKIRMKIFFQKMS